MRERVPMILSVVALFLAVLGWTSIGEAAKNLITGKEIKNESVTGRDVRNRSLTGADIRDGTLRARDFRPGELVVGAPGPRGPKGDVGPTVGVATEAGHGFTDLVAINASKAISAPAAGDLFVIGRVSSIVTCGADACNRRYEIFVDGAEVRGTLVEVHALANQTQRDSVAVFGAVSVGAGEHVVQLYASNSAAVTSHLDVSPNVGAILLGG